MTHTCDTNNKHENIWPKLPRIFSLSGLLFSSLIWWRLKVTPFKSLLFLYSIFIPHQTCVKVCENV